MGSFDGAEICELVGLFILNKLSKEFCKDNVGLYRDDGLLLLEDNRGRTADQARKQLHKLFEQFQLKITADVCHQSVNFLNITLKLDNGSYHPYRKPNNSLLYINRDSNHPPPIIKQLPISINKRLSSLSSDEYAFEKAAPLYNDALHRSNYQPNLKYSPDSSRSTARKRTRNIIWSNPPFSIKV